MIITEKCVFQVDPEAGLKLTEIADGVTVDEIRATTGSHFEVGKAHYTHLVLMFSLYTANNNTGISFIILHINLTRMAHYGYPTLAHYTFL